MWVVLGAPDFEGVQCMDFKVENSGLLTTHHHNLPFVQLDGPVCFSLAFSEGLFPAAWLP